MGKRAGEGSPDFGQSSRQCDQESQRWLDTLSAAEQEIDDSVYVVHVGNREADIYDLFVQPRRSNSQLLIRAEDNRKVQHELNYLIPTIEQAPVLGEQTIAVPRHHKQPKSCESVTLNVLLVEEATSPTEGKPIPWLLLTTLPIDTFGQAWLCVRWYSLRGLYACGGAKPYERFHFTLKSGCRIEHLQLETAQRLLKALATSSIVDWRLTWLTYAARLAPDEPCTAILEPAEWKLFRRKFEPKNRSKKPPTIRQAVRQIAQLGGFLARKGDGEPGLKTLGVLHHLLEGSQLAAKP